MFCDEKHIFSMIKDVHAVFGKCRSSQQVPNDENDHAPMWKKKSIVGATLLGSPEGSQCNWCDALDEIFLRELGFLSMYGQAKHTMEARRDLKEMKQREDLRPEKREKG